MNRFLTTTLVAACGLVTSLLTALLVTVLQRLTGFNVFTFSLWFFVPVGAAFTGCLAASGYYFGSLYFHTRPTGLLFVQTLIIAALTQLLIYYLEYATLVLDDGRRVSDLASFQRYMSVTLTTAHYAVRYFGDIGEVGSLGYGLALLQFVGFSIGGMFAYAMLAATPTCNKCDKYLRMLGTLTKSFGVQDAMVDYHDTLLGLPVDSPEFVAKAQEEHHVKKPTKGTLRLKVHLYGCPQCKRQRVSTAVGVHSGRDWNDVKELSQTFAIPDGVSALSAFRATR